MLLMTGKLALVENVFVSGRRQTSLQYLHITFEITVVSLLTERIGSRCVRIQIGVLSSECRQKQ